MQQEQALLDASTIIGGIAQTNNSYFTFLKNNITKPVGEMTVSELVAMHQECRKQYNQMLESLK